jgi:hypothetical protein
MAITRGRLAAVQTLPSTVGSIYTNPAGTKTAIKAIELQNNNTTSETVKLYNVPASGGSLGTPGDTNCILEIVLLSKEKFILDAPGDGRWLESTNDSIQAVTTTASKVVVEFFGIRDVA